MDAATPSVSEAFDSLMYDLGRLVRRDHEVPELDIVMRDIDRDVGLLRDAIENGDDDDRSFDERAERAMEAVVELNEMLVDVTSEDRWIRDRLDMTRRGASTLREAIAPLVDGLR